MSPARAYEILLMEAAMYPDSIPERTGELVAAAWEFRAKKLIDNGTWPKRFTAADWAASQETVGADKLCPSL